MKTNLLLAALAALSLVLPNSTFAEEKGDLVTVTAKGVGTSVESAKKDAGRNAIEQVVGQLVDAETLVENDDVIQDKILTYSAGVIEAMEVIGEPKQNEDGLFAVKVRADVRKTQLTQKLKAENVPVKVKGLNLAAVLGSRKDQREDMLAMFRKIFEDIPQKLVKAEPVRDEAGHPVFHVSSEGDLTVDMDISVDMEAYRAWTEDAMQKLDAMCTSKEDKIFEPKKAVFYDRRQVENGKVEATDTKWGSFGDLVDRNEKADVVIFVVKPTRKSANAMFCRIYYFKCDTTKDVWKALEPSFAMFHSNFYSMSIGLSLMMGDELIGSKNSGMYFWPCVCGQRYSGTPGIEVFLVPSLAMCSAEYNGSFYILPDLRQTFSLGKYTEEDLADVTDLKWSFDFKPKSKY